MNPSEVIITEKPVKPSFITTASGRQFYPLDPRAADVDIEDIGHALANQCRFSGHTVFNGQPVHYSVAEHSVRVSELLERWGESREVQLWGLLHDASEAYLVDLPSPLKQHPVFAAIYRAAEKALMDVIVPCFGLPTEQPSKVYEADAKLLATEFRDVMPEGADPWVELVSPLIIPIEPWSHDQARSTFLSRFEELTR